MRHGRRCVFRTVPQRLIDGVVTRAPLNALCDAKDTCEACCAVWGARTVVVERTDRLIGDVMAMYACFNPSMDLRMDPDTYVAMLGWEGLAVDDAHALFAESEASLGTDRRCRIYVMIQGQSMWRLGAFVEGGDAPARSMLIDCTRMTWHQGDHRQRPLDEPIAHDEYPEQCALDIFECLRDSLCCMNRGINSRL